MEFWSSWLLLVYNFLHNTKSCFLVMAHIISRLVSTQGNVTINTANACFRLERTKLISQMNTFFVQKRSLSRTSVTFGEFLCGFLYGTDPFVSLRFRRCSKWEVHISEFLLFILHVRGMWGSVDFGEWHHHPNCLGRVLYAQYSVKLYGYGHK